VPRVQLVDVTAGLLATQAVLAALFRRERTGSGGHVEQPLVSGALPHLVWAWADHAAANVIGASERVIGGRCACYAIYRCGDGERLAVGCLEPKFWRTLCEVLGVVELVGDGLRDDERGRAAHARIESILAGASAAAWRERLVAAGLPVERVCDVGDARSKAELWLGPLAEHVPMPDGSVLFLPSRAIPSLDRTPLVAAPRLGEHTEAALLAAAAPPETIAACVAALGSGA
jgi:crotonobetainyl-CoA:carnitine CoA-transferase CaiB-like acyl-CoA transferase